MRKRKLLLIKRVTAATVVSIERIEMTERVKVCLSFYARVVALVDDECTFVYMRLMTITTGFCPQFPVVF